MEVIYLVKKLTAISLFSGAGGMDIGFKNAGFNVILANEIDKDAAKTYRTNHPESTLIEGDIRAEYGKIILHTGVDLIFGGPPCQGFSVAGKMDPNDDRSTLVWSFLDIVKDVKPRAFVIENVKALATLEKWRITREEIFKRAQSMGYCCEMYVLNSSEFGVPQKRERVFFIGFLNKTVSREKMEWRLNSKKSIPLSIRDTIKHLGPAGAQTNPHTCTAKITFATNPVLRKSPYAGMIFNGMGRPLNIDETSYTLPASMGGNKTPIVDEEYLHGDAKENWVVEYHRSLLSKKNTPKFEEAPERLRRLTIKEAALIQTFPDEYIFEGSKSSIYRQIGNAVPCKLAQKIAESVREELLDLKNNVEEISGQITFDDLIDTSNIYNKGIIDIRNGIIDIE